MVGDVGDPDVLHSTIGKTRPAKIYHFAAYLAEPCERSPMEAVRINVEGFAGIRYPAIVGPGVRATGYITYMSAMIEFSARGDPYTITIEPSTRAPLVHVEDAVRAMIVLGRAPVENIQTTTYLINGVMPVPTVGEMAEIVRRRIPGAQIDFQPDPARQAVLKLSARLIDDAYARQGWNWRPVYDAYEKILDSYLTALQS